jgi:hypothetical protein
MAEQEGHDPLLERRLARNALATAFAAELIETVGRARGLALLGRAVNRMRSDEARRLARQWGDDSLTALGAHFRRLEAEQGLVQVLEATESRLVVRILRCPSTEAFRQLGRPELAPLFCASESAFIKAFNPRLRHASTQTIARGGATCEHTWYVADAGGESPETLEGERSEGN